MTSAILMAITLATALAVRAIGPSSTNIPVVPGLIVAPRIEIAVAHSFGYLEFDWSDGVPGFGPL